MGPIPDCKALGGWLTCLSVPHGLHSIEAVRFPGVSSNLRGRWLGSCAPGARAKSLAPDCEDLSGSLECLSTVLSLTRSAMDGVS